MEEDVCRLIKGCIVEGTNHTGEGMSLSHLMYIPFWSTSIESVSLSALRSSSPANSTLHDGEEEKRRSGRRRRERKRRSRRGRRQYTRMLAVHVTLQMYVNGHMAVM